MFLLTFKASYNYSKKVESTKAPNLVFNIVQVFRELLDLDMLKGFMAVGCKGCRMPLTLHTVKTLTYSNTK